MHSEPLVQKRDRSDNRETEEEIEERRKNLTEKQLRHIADIYEDNFEDNFKKDQAIDDNKFREVLIWECGVPSEFVENMKFTVKDFDFNSDGKLSLSEWAAAHAELWRLWAEHVTEDLQKALDEFEKKLSEENPSDDAACNALKTMCEKWQLHFGGRACTKLCRVMESPSVSEGEMVKFLNCLYVRIPMEWKGAFKLRVHRMIVCEEDVIFLGRKQKSDPPYPPPKLEVKNRSISLRDAEEFEFAMTTVNVFNDYELPYLVAAILEAGPKRRVYDSPLTVAILKRAWDLAHPFCFVRNLAHLGCIGALLKIALDERFEKEMSYALFLILAVLVLDSFVIHMFEVYQIYHQSRSGTRTHISKRCVTAVYNMSAANIFTAYEFVTTLYGLVVLFCCWCRLPPLQNIIASFAESFPDDSEFSGSHHPFWITFFCTAKLHLLLMRMLTMRSIGEQILPAYHAFANRASLTFLGFLVSLCIVFWLTYFTIPIGYGNYSPRGKDKGGTFWSLEFFGNMFLTYLAIFQLSFSGDFDMGDMEGQNPYFTVDQFNSKVEIQNPDPNPYYHYGICVFCMGVTLTMNVVALNIYIGVLGTKYEEMYGNRRQLFEGYRAAYTYKCLLTRNALNGVLGGLFPQSKRGEALVACFRKAGERLQRICPILFGSVAERKCFTSGSRGPLWFVYNRCSLCPEPDVPQVPEDLREMMKEMREMMKKMQMNETSLGGLKPRK